MDSIPSSTVPPSLNLFLTNVCNYECDFCFARFLDRRPHMPKEEAFEILRQASDLGLEKVTFVGGEPFLVPYIDEVIAYAKDLGLTTCVVTNASRLAPDRLASLADDLDWLAVSIDSGIEATEETLGRGKGNHIAPAVKALQVASELGIRTKINTVVTKLNVGEDMSWVLEATSPDRWKVFQMLTIEGQNDEAKALGITREAFLSFVQRHRPYSPIWEDNDAMSDTYIMIDPQGHIFHNGTGTHVYGPKVIDVGLASALDVTPWRIDAFEERGGRYDWSRA